jgi:hypothetical protein
MAATIYAARLGAYMADAIPKTAESWHKHRVACIEVSITEAVMICEAVERDFPSSEREAAGG